MSGLAEISIVMKRLCIPQLGARAARRSLPKEGRYALQEDESIAGRFIQI